MSIPQDPAQENSSSYYMPWVTLACSAAAGVFAYVMYKFQRTPVMEKVEKKALESLYTGDLDPALAALLPAEALLPPKTLQNPMTEKTFINHHYGEKTKDAVFFASRFSSIGRFFNLNTFVPVRGDGNCFVNAAAAGLLNKINKDPSYLGKLIAIIEAYDTSHKIYVQKDPSAQEEHHINFYKAGDFRQVVYKLKQLQPTLLFEDDHFNAAFTRILRYILTHSAPQDAVSERCGTEIDSIAVWDLSRIFELNAKVAVVEGATPADSQGPDSFLVTYGDMNQSIIDTNQRYSDTEKTADFVILRKSGHFVCGY
jgi:hypothetical protein